MTFSADTWIALIALALSVGWPTFQLFTKSMAKDEADQSGEEYEKRALEAVAALRKDVEADIANLHRQGDSLRATVIEHDRTIIRTDGAVANLPSKSDTQKLSLQIVELVGEIRAMKVEMEHLGRSSTNNGAKLDRLEQHIYQREG